MEKSAGKIVKIRDFVTRRGRWAAAGLVMLFYRFLPVRWQCSISGVSVLEIECISPSGGGRNARDGGHALISVSPRQANHCTFNNIYLYVIITCTAVHVLNILKFITIDCYNNCR